LAGFHALNFGMYRLARQYRHRGMAAYTELQQAELAAEDDGYTATRHQQEGGTGYFDRGAELGSAGPAATPAPRGPTEGGQVCARAGRSRLARLSGGIMKYVMNVLRGIGGRALQTYERRRARREEQRRAGMREALEMFDYGASDDPC